MRLAPVATVLAVLATASPMRADEDPLLARARTAAEKRDAKGLMGVLIERYRTVKGMSGDGEILTEVMVSGRQETTTTRFTVAVERPNRYRVTWSAPAGGRAPSTNGTAWNAGQGPYLYVNPPSRWGAADSDDIALGAAAGVSGGATMLAGLVLDGGRSLGEIEGLTFDGEDRVGSEPCWMVSGSSRIVKKDTLWISPQLLVRQRRQTITPKAALDAMHVADDKEMDEVLAKAGVPRTEENRRRMAEAMKEAQAVAKEMGDAHVTTTFQTLRPNADGTDFAFTPPAGTPRADSMLKEMLQSAPAGPAH